MSLPEKVRVACRILDMRQADVMAYGFRGESVVIIQGPVGFKHIFTPEQLDEQRAKEKAEVAAVKAAKKEEARAKAEAKKEAKAKREAKGEKK